MPGLDTVNSGLFGLSFSAILGIAGFGAVLCLRFPAYLTFADLRPFYTLGYVRAIIHVTLVTSFLLGTHHWHHSADRDAVDKNFAVHTPIWDLLFGTYYLPDRWPSAYGLAGRSDVPAR